MNEKSFLIPLEKLEIRSARSSGPGGQHVNKVETKIEIRFHLDSADWIPLSVRERMSRTFSSRINKNGEFILTCEESRSRSQNLENAISKLREMILSCWYAPKKRIKTKATRSSKEKRLSDKKLTSRKKLLRSKYE